MSLTYGELFAGYDGLGMGVRSVLGGETAWFAEYDKAPSAILAHHYPGVPNIGDVTTADWASLPPVDVITGGSPCQDLSHAGKRKGMTDGTRSNLWVAMREAVAVIRPRLVVWENVRGAYSAAADSDVEHCPGCMGDPRHRGPALRALGRVLGDLADLGYDARWYGLRAADVGAPHGRFRVFLFATPADADVSGLGGLGRLDACGRDAHGRGRADGPGATTEPEALLPTPRCADGVMHDLRMDSATLKAAGHRGRIEDAVALLLPTPRATDGTKGGPNQRGSSGDLMLPSAVQLLPTPSVADVEGGRKHRSGARSDELLLNGIAHHQAWGDYAPAIARWETILGRPAPAPTEPGPKGTPRLSPAFTEWMMGLPPGWVTDPAIGISRNDQLKACGNGVVPQQAAAATAAFVHDTAEEAAA